jgi:glycosyltransferase involved in cell wall biosynthesis
MRERSDLRRLDCRAVPSSRDEIRAFLLVRNEIRRLPFTLAHHRALGVQRFFVVDNGSSDGTIDYLLAETDVHLYETTASYQDARNGIDWLELLLHVYGQDRWCLLLDADEHLVYPECETVGLPEFCRALEARGLNCLATSFVDLYADGSIADTHLSLERPPLEICRFFDSRGYYSIPCGGSHVPRIFGGSRARLFWPEIDLYSYSSRMASYVERAFDQVAYLAEHADVAAEVREGRLRSALQHFVDYGRFDPRSVRIREVPEWPEHVYLALYPDVRQSVKEGTFASGLEHFVRHGQFEGRLVWNSGPPCVSQVPLVRCDTDVSIDIGRHSLTGGTWRRRDAVGGALLHFKLTSDLVPRAETVLKLRGTARESSWALENKRYREVIERDPTLSAMTADSVSYRDARQLVEVGIITSLSEL